MLPGFLFARIVEFAYINAMMLPNHLNIKSFLNGDSLNVELERGKS